MLVQFSFFLLIIPLSLFNRFYQNTLPSKSNGFYIHFPLIQEGLAIQFTMDFSICYELEIFHKNLLLAEAIHVFILSLSKRIPECKSQFTFWSKGITYNLAT